MTAWLRRAGRGRDPDGGYVTWSVAEGRRGRRWRVVRAAGGGVTSSLLYELDPAGRFAHLELATPAGLLTLHPEGDGTLHGNAIIDGAVRHVVGMPWAPEWGIGFAGDAFSTTVGAWRPAAGYVVRAELALDGDTTAPRLERDERGIPVLDDAEEWPLET
jgi:hypothetical protein